MSRPEHLRCVNTAEGIRRINEDQALYDKDPEEYERVEREHKERMKEEAKQEREYWEQQEPRHEG